MKREKNLETILAISVGLVVVYLLTAGRFFLVAAVILGVIGLFVNPLAGRITRLWLKLSEIIGLVVSVLLLSGIFFVLLLPTAMLSRLFSKKKGLRLERSDDSTYYTSRNHVYSREDCKNIW